MVCLLGLTHYVVTSEAGEEEKGQPGWGECGEVVQTDEPVLQTHNSL